MYYQLLLPLVAFDLLLCFSIPLSSPKQALVFLFKLTAYNAVSTNTQTASVRCIH